MGIGEPIDPAATGETVGGGAGLALAGEVLPDRSSPSQPTGHGDVAGRHRPAKQPTIGTTLRARLGRRIILAIGRGIFRLRLDFSGFEHVPPEEPLIVAAAPHRNWIDSFLMIMALPPTPRLVFIGSAEGMFDTWWKRLALTVMGGVVPVSSRGQLNRDALESSLAILAGGQRLGIFPEGWDQTMAPPTEVQPFKRGIAFLSQRSGRRVLPVAISGTDELWRGKTLRLRIGPPLDALESGADRDRSRAYAELIRDAIVALLPEPPPATGEPRRWRWLTRMLG